MPHPLRPLAIFDLDGTLIDSRETIQQAMQDAFTAMGLPPPDYQAVRRTIGLGLVEVMQALAPELAETEQKRLAHFYREAFVLNRASGRGREPLYVGARDLIEALFADGWHLGIATGKARRGLEHFFDMHGMRAMFHAAFCAEDGPGKPHPFMVQANLAALNIEARRALLVGDATHDMAMARAAQVRGIGVSWGFGMSEEILAAGADELTHDFAQLMQSLTRFQASLQT